MITSSRVYTTKMMAHLQTTNGQTRHGPRRNERAKTQRTSHCYWNYSSRTRMATTRRTHTLTRT